MSYQGNNRFALVASDRLYSAVQQITGKSITNIHKIEKRKLLTQTTSTAVAVASDNNTTTKKSRKGGHNNKKSKTK